MSARTTTPREWALAIGGGLGLALILVLLLRGGGDAAVDPPATLAPPPASPPAPTAPPPASPPADLSLTGLRAGPDGGMAIISSGGRQYLLRPGRSLPGGITLRRVEAGRAILSGPGGEVTLAFPDGNSTAPAAALSGPPGGDPTPWRLALRPERDDGGAVTGWRLDSTARLPALAAAGLQAGDVLLEAGGTPLISEEKIIELPQELASNGQLELKFRRGGTVSSTIVKP